MPAFYLGPHTAALVRENDANPAITLVTLSSGGILVSGRDAVQQLRDACNLALDAADAFTKPSPSQDTPQ